jgi:hypothetical protein
MTETDVRLALAVTMRATLADEAAHHNWTYAAIRPEAMVGTRGHYPAGERIYSDCSKGVQRICFWTVGAPDPMKNGWGAYGNSSTICAVLAHLDHPSELLVGDPVTFGVNGDEHAAMTLEAGPDPLLWSDGHQGAPNTYRLSWDRRDHQLLRLPVAVYVPTPQDLLRAKTGYWSWMQWKLGEGAWSHYAPAAAKVRPNVPIPIPKLWWDQRAAFLKARKHPNGPSVPVKAPA